MSNPLPNVLALTTINDGDPATAAPLRNNFAAIQTAVNAFRVLFAGGMAGQVVTVIDGTDLELDYPPGHEIGYDQITAAVNVTGTSIGGATTIIPGSSHTFDGAPVIAEFFAPTVEMPTVSGATMAIVLFEGGTAIAILATIENVGSAQLFVPVHATMRFTPAGGAHTYSIKAYVSSTTGTPNIFAQTGSGGAEAPAYLRFTKV